jgi:hypothetical protein
MLRCTCGNSFMVPPGVASVVCPYCHQQLAVPVTMASESRRTWAAILLAGAVIALLIGALTRSWLTMSSGRDEVHVGLLGAEECEDGECQRIDFDGRGGDSIMVILSMVGKIALGGTFALIGMLVWTGTRVLARKPAFGPSVAGIVIAALAATGATMWAIQIKKNLFHEAMTFGYSYLLYVAGAISGLIGCVMARSPSRE